MAEKMKVILFGTGQGAKNGFKHLKKRYEIVGFVDNDTQKQGTTFMGHTVFAPADLAQQSFDRVVICSMYADEIQDQLSLQLNIPFEKIELLEKDIRVYGSGNPIGCAILAFAVLVAVAYGIWRLIAGIFAD